MTSITLHPESLSPEAQLFKATSGGRGFLGRTMGEALDRLVSDRGESDVFAKVFIEPIECDEEYVEPHLIEENGMLVIAGGYAWSW